MMNEQTYDVVSIRDLEQRVLNYMMQSNDNFFEVQKSLHGDEFTFQVHGLLYGCMLEYKLHSLDKLGEEQRDLNWYRTLLSIYFEKHYFIKMTTCVDILSLEPSQSIEDDLNMLHAIAMDKELAMESCEMEIEGTIETPHSFTRCIYANGILVYAETTDIFKLSPNLYYNFEDIFNVISSLDLEKDTDSVYMTFTEEGSIEAFEIKRDVVPCEWFDKICLWADKYDLDKFLVPRSKHQLEALLKLDLTDKKIEELPKEIKELKNLKILIMEHNLIKELPQWMQEYAKQQKLEIYI